MRPRHRPGIAVALLLALVALAGCGGSAEQSDRVGQIEVTGRNSEDLGVAQSLAEHLNRGCKRNSGLNYSAFKARVAGSDSASRALLRFYLVRYGDLLAAYQSLLERCVTYESITVDGDGITVDTSLGHRLIDSVTAGDTCREIAASHIADSEPGKVLDVMGEVLADCKTQAG